MPIVLFNHLSLGVTTSYVFGTITNSETVYYDEIVEHNHIHQNFTCE